MKKIISTASAAALAFLGSVVLLVGIEFGIERGEMRLDGPLAQKMADRLDLAENISVGLFIAVELASSFVALTVLPRVLCHYHWIVKAFALLLVCGLASYCCTVLMLMMGGGPDIAVWIHDAISRWTRSVIT